MNGGAVQGFPAGGTTQLVVAAGVYTVTEPAAAGYTTRYDNCANVVVAAGATATCTIINDDIASPPPPPGTLVIVKVVVNDNGGIGVASDFTYSVNGGALAVVPRERGDGAHRQPRHLHGHRIGCFRVLDDVRELHRAGRGVRRDSDVHDHQ